MRYVKKAPFIINIIMATPTFDLSYTSAMLFVDIQIQFLAIRQKSAWKSEEVQQQVFRLHRRVEEGVGFIKFITSCFGF